MTPFKHNKGPIVFAECCGDYIQSYFRHDFVRCRCKTSFITGGGFSVGEMGGRVRGLTPLETATLDMNKITDDLDKNFKNRTKLFLVANKKTTKQY